MKKISVIFLTMCVLLNVMSLNFAFAESMNIGDRVKTAFLKKLSSTDSENDFISTDFEIIDDFSDVIPDLYKEVTISKSEDIYVDGYAGCYVDNNKLIICVTDDTIRYHSCENRENVIYRQVENSMNDLIEIQKEVGNKYESLYGQYKSGTEEYKLLHSLQGSDSSVVDNVVYVYIKDLTVEKEKLYRNLIEDDERIVLVETDGENIEDTIG
ncbi:MAG: hypothetical protein IJM14_08920 [Lachnospiraceae bacterium]|nr:hypothetical protein [Lachnospiraceae bacterium]